MQRASLIATVFSILCLGSASNAQPAPTPEVVARQHKIIECYKAGSDTVRMMYNCSGQWVTPRVLTLCFLEADCPVISDPVSARSVAEAELGPNKLETKLTIDMKDILSVPSRSAIGACQQEKNVTNFQECVARRSVPAPIAAALECQKLPTDKDRAICLTKASGSDIPALVNCMADKPMSVAGLRQCVTKEPWAKVEALGSCLTNSSDKEAGGCLIGGATPEQKETAECLFHASKNAEKSVNCLSKLDPQAFARVEEVTCVTHAITNAEAVACVGKSMGGDGARLAQCAAVDHAKIAECLFGDSPKYRTASEVMVCATNAHDTSSFIANCSDIFIKDQKTREALACAAESGGDKQKLAACAASSVLPPDLARYAACAAASQGPTSFAICAAGPIMNEEWRIAAECAVQTGGNPVGFAGCTAGRLTLKELTQCLSGGSCFGPNNTIVKAYTNAFNDLLHGPGQGNEYVKALHTLQDASGGPNSVINNPGQLLGGENSDVRQFVERPMGGENSVLNKGARDAYSAVEKGSQDAAAAAKKAADDSAAAAKKAADDTAAAAKKAADDAAAAAKKAADDAAAATKKAADDAAAAAKKAADDAAATAKKAADDAAAAAKKAAEDALRAIDPRHWHL
jgi:hypothetical protein